MRTPGRSGLPGNAMLRLFVLTTLACGIMSGTALADIVTPDWLKLDPPLIVSDEGFRGVMWCTPSTQIDWKLKRVPLGSSYTRADEDFNVFGVRAKYITYTFRCAVLYGVRIDIEGRDNVKKALEKVKAEYPPVGKVQVKGASSPAAGRDITQWSRKSTYVCVTLPKTNDGLGQIYIWGRDRKFADDTPDPVYLAKPIELNSQHKKYKPRQYVIYRRSGPITIDGNINEKAWQDAEWTDAFEDDLAPYTPPPWKATRLKMVYDDQNIYFAARLQEENIWGTFTTRDSIVYWDNDFEIFLDPTADAVNYFEFEWNFLNTQFDMWHENDNYRNALADGRYDAPGLRSAVQYQGTVNNHHDVDESLTFEIKIPFADMLPRNPKMTLPRGGDVWRFNSYRINYLHVYNQLFPYLLPLEAEEFLLQSKLPGDVHIPEVWARLIFSDLCAGPVRDKELERLFPILDPPPAPTSKRSDMVHFEACTITMGPDPTDPAHSPAHKVDVPKFWMDRYEVTVREYCDFLNQGGNDAHYHEAMVLAELCGIAKDGPGRYHVVEGREDFPVVMVNPDNAMAYAESAGKTLPTEAMWDRAARGLKGRQYPWGNEPVNPSRANYDFQYGGTLPVGSFSMGASPEGIFDLCGNVKEWTSDIFHKYPGGAEYEHMFNFPFFVPPFPDPGEFSMLNRPLNRGGGWTSQEKCVAAGYRDGQGWRNCGFRCVKTK